MSEPGYWYTRQNGDHEWRTEPRCPDCGGKSDYRQVKPIEDAADDEIIATITCIDCGKIHCHVLKPSTEAIEYGRMLAAKYGW